jgi:hypothetical protein
MNLFGNVYDLHAEKENFLQTTNHMLLQVIG